MKYPIVPYGSRDRLWGVFVSIFIHLLILGVAGGIMKPTPTRPAVPVDTTIQIAIAPVNASPVARVKADAGASKRPPEKSAKPKREAGLKQRHINSDELSVQGHGETGELVQKTVPPTRPETGGGAQSAAPAYNKNPIPLYPEVARRRGQEGTTLLAVLVDRNGHPTDVSVKRSSGYPLLDGSAVKAVSKWRFFPAQRGGQPVDSLLELPVRFQLNE